jgi:hypothetical protein
MDEELVKEFWRLMEDDLGLDESENKGLYGIP